MEVQIQGNKINCPLKDKWLIATPEELIRQRYICRLANEYQYQLEQMGKRSLLPMGIVDKVKLARILSYGAPLKTSELKKVH